jgi:hypothetical protein
VEAKKMDGSWEDVFMHGGMDLSVFFLKKNDGDGCEAEKNVNIFVQAARCRQFLTEKKSWQACASDSRQVLISMVRLSLARWRVHQPQFTSSMLVQIDFCCVQCRFDSGPESDRHLSLSIFDVVR